MKANAKAADWLEKVSLKGCLLGMMATYEEDLLCPVWAVGEAGRCCPPEQTDIFCFVFVRVRFPSYWQHKDILPPPPGYVAPTGRAHLPKVVPSRRALKILEKPSPNSQGSVVFTKREIESLQACYHSHTSMWEWRTLHWRQQFLKKRELSKSRDFWQAHAEDLQAQFNALSTPANGVAS